MDYSAEDSYSSINSPSFADLLCTQNDDQQSKPLPPPSSHLKNQEPEFEFSPANKPTSITRDLYKNSSADILVSKNNQRQLHEFLRQKKQSQDKNQPAGFKEQLPESRDTQCMKKADHKTPLVAGEPNLCEQLQFRFRFDQLGTRARFEAKVVAVETVLENDNTVEQVLEVLNQLEAEKKRGEELTQIRKAFQAVLVGGTS
ncbi:hypothetical protein JRO89_XS06G0067600 [Xanthoceras sorbifolium]|uniref:Uncharacterized protein n=1 Tax=Xanthoceras sorbifolium TaxID=99658 RepID=A0ABQ8HXC6_9ROSI|nr:hypothetical protein JRO89_XS06G0067600 [Xanthoceras sorbifolium]